MARVDFFKDKTNLFNPEYTFFIYFFTLDVANRSGAQHSSCFDNRPIQTLRNSYKETPRVSTPKNFSLIRGIPVGHLMMSGKPSIGLML